MIEQSKVKEQRQITFHQPTSSFRTEKKQKTEQGSRKRKRGHFSHPAIVRLPNRLGDEGFLRTRNNNSTHAHAHTNLEEKGELEPMHFIV